MQPTTTLNSTIPFHIHFLEVVRKECTCSEQVQQAIFMKGTKILRDAWIAEGGEA